MEIHRSPMEKILSQNENATIITNPKDRCRTFLRKLAYRFSILADWLKRSGGKTGR